MTLTQFVLQGEGKVGVRKALTVFAETYRLGWRRAIRKERFPLDREWKEWETTFLEWKGRVKVGKATYKWEKRWVCRPRVKGERFSLGQPIQPSQQQPDKEGRTDEHQRP